jgi:hypothetical protein
MSNCSGCRRNIAETHHGRTQILIGLVKISENNKHSVAAESIKRKPLLLL